MRFDLVNLVLKSQKKMEMIPKKNCILMKICTPKATGMLFSNGKIVCTGANTEENIKNVAKKFTNIIQVSKFVTIYLILTKFSVRWEIINYSLM
jgi:transcription initiation factor TFIID TATA-box-binding protein